MTKSTTTRPPSDWELSFEAKELIKKEFHHLDTIYFNTAYFGPSPYSAKQKLSRALQKELDPSFYNYNTWMGISERMRQQISTLLNVSADHITHSTSTGDIVSLVANGHKFKNKERVAAVDKDYPSNILPWMRAQERGLLSFDLLPLNEELPSVEWLEKNLHPKTKIFNISHVTFDTGKKVDILSLGKYLKTKDILFIVDATQSLGGLELTPEEISVIDVLACSSYKWMLGPYGHAFAYFSDKALEQIEHLTGNWIVSPESKVVTNLLNYTTETLPGARKFDRGQASNMLTMACLEASLEFLSEIGLKNVENHNAQLRDYFLANFPKENFELITPKNFMANILALKGKNIDSVALERELRYQNIDVSVRQGNIRLSFSIFNNLAQVDQLIEVLKL